MSSRWKSGEIGVAEDLRSEFILILRQLRWSAVWLWLPYVPLQVPGKSKD